MANRKTNPSPVTPSEITPPEITPPEVNDAGSENPSENVKTPVVSIEELSKQLAAMQEAEKKREEREAAREEEHKAKMAELDAKVAAVDKTNFDPAMAKIMNDKGTRQSYADKADRMKQKLAKEPMKTIYIPKNASEPDGIKFHVQLNGFIVEIPKDTYVDVPMSIWQVVVDSQRQIAKAGEKYRLDLNGKQARLERNIDPVAPSIPTEQ